MGLFKALGVLTGLERLMPDVVAYNVAMSAWQKEEFWQCAMLLLRALWNCQLQASAITYRALPS